jgi:hypothetical protein
MDVVLCAMIQVRRNLSAACSPYKHDPKRPVLVAQASSDPFTDYVSPFSINPYGWSSAPLVLQKAIALFRFME